MSETITCNKGSSVYVYCILILFAFANTLYAQQDSILKSYQKPVTHFSGIEKGFGITPEIDFINGSLGVGICRGKFVIGPRTIAGSGYYAGVCFDTKHQMIAPDFGYWIGFFKKNFGAQLGIRGLYYVNKSYEGFVIRPEAGIGLVKGQLSYGYNICTNKSEIQMASHCLTLMLYFGLHSVRYKTY